MPSPYRYDAFISYRHRGKDETFARQLVKDLESAGYKAAIDKRDFSPNANSLEEMERCVKESHFTLAVVSPRYFQSGNTEEEAIICKVLDMGERRRRLVPLIIEHVEMPTWLYAITGIDFAEQDPLVPPLDRLKEMLGASCTEHQSPPTCELFMVPFSHNDFFTGREDLLARLHGALSAVHSRPYVPRDLPLLTNEDGSIADW